MDKRAALLVFMLAFSIFTILSPIKVAKAGTQTFGYTTVGSAGLGPIGDAIRGSVFTATLNGSAQSITAYINNIGGTAYNAKCAIYNYTDLSLVASTDEESVSVGVAWRTFEFSSPPNVTAGEEYVLVAWGENTNLRMPYDAGSTDQTLVDSEAYNGFPDPLVVSTSADAKHSIYCTVQEFSEYNYYFYGLYDENTGLLEDAASRAVDVTAYWDDETVSETFEVNGSRYKSFDTSPQYFHFELGTVDREYWLSAEEGNETTIQIYIFNASLTSYTLTFRDWTGALATYSWVSALRNINGTAYTVDKRKVDEQKKVVMGLQTYTKYVIQVEAVVGTTYTWGDLAMTSDTSVDLVVKGTEFPHDVIQTYRYVRAYGYRENYNTSHDSIIHCYEDTKESTTTVNITIYYGNDTVAHSYEYSDTDSFTYTWSEADNETSYYSTVTITHGDYGTMVFSQSFLRGFADSPFDLDFLGTLPGNVEVSTLLPMGILLFATLSFSALTAGIGGIVVVALAGIMTAMGWVSFDTNLLVFAAILAVLYTVIKNYHRVTVR